jgi:class 3 adenylate cyclase
VGRLRQLFDPGVPEPVEPTSLRRIAKITLVLSLLLAAGNCATRFALPPGSNIAAYDVFLGFNLAGHAVVIAALASIVRSSGRIEEVGGRLRLMLVAAGWTVIPSTWILGGVATMLNLAFATMFIGIARMFLGWRLGLWALGSVVLTDLVFATLRLAGGLPDESPLPETAILDNPGHAAVFVGWRAVVVVVMFVMAGYAANRYRRSEHQLRTLNTDLEERVAKQVAELERATRLRRYLSPQLVDELLEADEDPGSSRDRRPITVLFADLRGFTGMVERLAPETLAQTLHLYFTEVTRVAFEHGGTIDKFIGDAIMIVFGAPRATGESDQARRCVAMACEIQSAVAGLTDRLAAIEVAPLEVRIGIGSGLATVGTFGAEHRAEYTAVGVPVNRAARLEPLALPGGILVDARTRELVADAAAVEAFGEIALKGFGTPQVAFLVVGSAPVSRPTTSSFSSSS